MNTVDAVKFLSRLDETEGEQKVVQLLRLNWDEECQKDLLTGHGFIITENAMKKQQKTYNGIHSQRFGTDYDDEDAFAERYSCKCKETKGRIYENEICPVCGTKVEFRDVDLKMFGWISLKGNYIIQPSFYAMLRDAIGKKTFPEIIEYDVEYDSNGNAKKNEDKTHPYRGIGLIEFKKRFDEVLSFYYKRRKKKRAVIDEIRRERAKVFASHIPVYSAILRPLRFINESFLYSAVDRKYSVIYADSRLLSDKAFRKKSRRKLAEKDDPEILTAIQKHLVVSDPTNEKNKSLWDLIFGEINQKKGHIKNQILGGRINFSARNVIIPDPELRADEVRLGYLTFLELYKYEIIAHLEKIMNITTNEASNEWTMGTIKFSPKIYEIMMYLVKKRKPMILINRNPTINYGSLLCVKIVDIKREYEDDYTMSLPIQILKVLNADFDGDVLNIISLKVKKLTKAFDKTYNPRKNMYISRNDGLFNDDFNLFKDQLIGLYEFNNI